MSHFHPHVIPSQLGSGLRYSPLLASSQGELQHQSEAVEEGEDRGARHLGAQVRLHALGRIWFLFLGTSGKCY